MGNQQGQEGMPNSRRPELVARNYQSGGGSPTTARTVIRHPPGTTTVVFIAPTTAVDGELGRTQIVRLPPIGDILHVQVEIPRPIQPSTATSNPASTSTSILSPVQPCKSPPGNDQGPSGTFSPSAMSPGRPSHSRYNFQSQRCRLPALTMHPDVTQLILGFGDEIITVDPPTTGVPVESGIQILPQGQVATNSSSTSPWDILNNTQHIFIGSANNGDLSGGQCDKSQPLFNLMDSYGNRVFSAVDKRARKRSDGWCCCPLETPLDMAIDDANGVEVMILSGDTGRVALHSSQSGLCGYVQEQIVCCPNSTNYYIKDQEGNLNFKLWEHRSSATEFELSGNGMIGIGHMGKIWTLFPDSKEDMSLLYGISFPKDMTGEEKALMLGALLSIYWKYFVDTSRETRMARGSRYCRAVCFLIMILVIIGISVLTTYIIVRPSK